MRKENIHKTVHRRYSQEHIKIKQHMWDLRMNYNKEEEQPLC